ncbi:MAG: hypothetical protein WA840_23225, partial [Caulobacteraceae bacterium]
RLDRLADRFAQPGQPSPAEAPSGVSPSDARPDDQASSAAVRTLIDARLAQLELTIARLSIEPPAAERNAHAPA